MEVDTSAFNIFVTVMPEEKAWSSIATGHGTASVPNVSLYFIKLSCNSVNFREISVKKLCVITRYGN